MTDDHTPRYGEAAEPEGPAEPSVDQPALFDEPAATPHDIELVAEPEGSWEPDEEPPWDPEADPGAPEGWEPPVDDAWDEPGPDPEPPAPSTPAEDDPSATHVGADVPLADETGAAEHGDEDLLLGPIDDVASLEAEEDDPAAGQDPEHVSAARPSSGGAVSLLAVLVAALLLLTGWLGYTVADNRGAAPIASTRASALAAGRDAARLVFSYDYRRLDKDFAAASAVTTGKFKTDYESTTKKLVGDVAPRYKAVLLAEVSEAGVITASANQVQLLVFLDVQSTSTLAATPKITPRRLKMTMQRSGDRWLVSAVDAF